MENIVSIIHQYVGRNAAVSFNIRQHYRGGHSELHPRSGSLASFAFAGDLEHVQLSVKINDEQNSYDSRYNTDFSDSLLIHDMPLRSLVPAAIRGKVERLESFVRDLSGIDSPKIQLIAREGTEFVAEKFILCARSKVFAKMFDTDMKEKSNMEIAMPFAAEAIDLFLAIVYVRPIDKEKVRAHLPELMQLVDMYQLGKLLEVTGLHVRAVIAKENAIEVFCLAAKHKEPEMLQFAFELIRTHREELAKTDQWKVLVSEERRNTEELEHFARRMDGRALCTIDIL